MITLSIILHSNHILNLIFWIGIVLVALAVASMLLFLWFVHPASDKRTECIALAQWNYAHRGLWDLKQGIPENSIPAFLRAGKYNFGIELDVHLSADGEVVVFHDDDFSRICGIPDIVETLTYPEMEKLRLSGTKEHIPLLRDVLKALMEQETPVPLLLELKLPDRKMELCKKVMEIMPIYTGPYLIESFNPLGLRYMRKYHPEVIRGQLSTVYDSSVKVAALIKLCSTSLVCNTLSRPHFVAFNYKYTNRLGLWLNERLFKAPIFVWTVRSVEIYEQSRGRYASVIFEHFLPPAKPSIPEKHLSKGSFLP